MTALFTTLSQPRLALGLACALLAPGCAEEPGELDPEVVHALSRRPGDAVGLARSGFYDVDLTLVSCDCPDYAGLEILTPCPDTATGDAYFISVELIQADGLILIRMADESITGGLNVDGTFSTGGVFDLSSPLASIEYVTRLDGTFDPESFNGEFEATLLRHLEGDAVTGADATRTNVDCGEHFELAGRLGL